MSAQQLCVCVWHWVAGGGVPPVTLQPLAWVGIGEVARPSCVTLRFARPLYLSDRNTSNVGQRRKGTSDSWHQKAMAGSEPASAHHLPPAFGSAFFHPGFCLRQQSPCRTLRPSSSAASTEKLLSAGIRSDPGISLARLGPRPSPEPVAVPRRRSRPHGPIRVDSGVGRGVRLGQTRGLRV